MKLFSLFGELTMKGTDEVTKELAEVTKEAEKTDSTFSKLMNKVTSAGAKMTSVGKSMSIGITAPLLALGGGAIKVAIDYEEAMRDIQVATGATGEALQGLEDDLKSVVAEVPNTVGEVAGAIGNLNTYTGAAGESLQRLTESVLDASRMLGEDGVANSEAFGKAMNQWQIPAEKGPALLDSLYKSTQDYGVGLGEIINQLNTYGPVLQNAGFTTEQTADLFGRLSAAGLDVSRIMPGVNAALRDAAAAGQDPQQALNGMIESIRNATTESEALAMATEYFGAEGAQRLTTAIRNDIIPPMQEWGNEILNVDGLIAESAEQNKTFAESFSEFKNQVSLALEPFGTAMLEIAQDILPPFINGATRIAEIFQNMNPILRNTILILAGLLAAAGPLLLFFGSLTSSITTLLPVIRTLSTALLGLAANPIGAVLTAIGLLIAIVPIIVKNWDKISEFFANLWDGIKYTFQNSMDWIKIKILQWVNLNLKALNKLLGWVPGLGSMFEEAQATVDHLIENIDLEKAARKNERELKKVQKNLDDTTDSVDELNTQLNQNTHMYETNTDAVNQSAKALEEEARARKRASDEARQATIDNYNKMGDAIMTALRNQYREEEKAQKDSLKTKLDEDISYVNNYIREIKRKHKADMDLLDEETQAAIKEKQDRIDEIEAIEKAEEEAREQKEFLDEKARLEHIIAHTRSSKEKLKAEEDLAKLLADHQERENKKARQREKDKLNQEIQDIKDNAKEKRKLAEEELQKEIDIEEERKEFMQDNHKKEMEAVTEHYETLLEEHNLMNEAMRLAEKEHQDEMLQLLAEYNPHWQDAGRSFGERMIDGLISTRESMKQTATNLLTAVQPVFEKIKEEYNFAKNTWEKTKDLSTKVDDGKTISSYLVGEDNTLPKNASLPSGYNAIAGLWNSGKKQEINVNVNARVLSRRDADAVGESVTDALRTQGVNP